MLLTHIKAVAANKNRHGTQPQPKTSFLCPLEGLLHYDARTGAITPDMIGELCVCWLADGRVVAKHPIPGDEPGTFDLLSAFAPAMRAQYVLQAALVIEIEPAAEPLRKSQALAQFWGMACLNPNTGECGA